MIDIILEMHHRIIKLFGWDDFIIFHLKVTIEKEERLDLQNLLSNIKTVKGNMSQLYVNSDLI